MAFMNFDVRSRNGLGYRQFQVEKVPKLTKLFSVFLRDLFVEECEIPQPIGQIGYEMAWVSTISDF